MAGMPPPPLFVRYSAVLLGMCIPKSGSWPAIFPFAGRRFFSPCFPVRGRAGRPWSPARPHSRPKCRRCRLRGGRERRWRSGCGGWPCPRRGRPSDGRSVRRSACSCGSRRRGSSAGHPIRPAGTGCLRAPAGG